MKRWERALNGKFRRGDKVKYKTTVKAVSGTYTIDCTGVVSAEENGQVFILRDRSVGQVDEKHESEIRKA